MGRVRNLTVLEMLYPLEHARCEVGRAINASPRWSLPDIHGFGADVSLDFHVSAAVINLSLRRGS